MEKRKKYFSSQEISQIISKKYKKIDDLTEIVNIKNDEYTLIKPIIPADFESSRKFMKHAKEVLPKRFYSYEEAIKSKKTPVELRKEAFDSIKDPFYSGYSFLPLGRDRRKRKISLTECLEGSKIYSYSEQIKKARIIVTPYKDAERIAEEGAEIVLSVPSRTTKKPKYDFKLLSIPIIDNQKKYIICTNLFSNHSCPSKIYNIKYNFLDDKESSRIFNFCAHEIAGYLKIIDYFWNNEKNIIPLEMSQIAIPSRKTAEFYKNLENSVLVEDEKLKSKEKIRKMNTAEKEIALWTLVLNIGHDDTFFPTQSIDGLLKEYKWI